MKAVTRILAGGVAAAALFTAAPAAAQYYPSPYGSGTAGVIGQVINQVLGGGMRSGYGGYGGYGSGANSQAIVGQCVNAVQARLAGSYGYGGGYGGYSGYGYNNGYATGGARVLGISRVERRSSGGLTVRGVASSGRAPAYGYANSQVDLTFTCRTDYRGYIVDMDIDAANSTYGYNAPYSPYNTDYSQYGYRRY